jgi:hypothetical protein
MRPETDARRHERRRILAVLTLAAAFPAVLILAGSIGGPELAVSLIAVVVPALFVYGQIRGRRTREATDERARDNHRHAASISWHVMALALGVTVLWMYLHNGIRAAEPYLYLLVAQTASYTIASLWRRWRGL